MMLALLPMDDMVLSSNVRLFGADVELLGIAVPREVDPICGVLSCIVP